MRRTIGMITLLVSLLVVTGSPPVHAQPDPQLTCQGENIDVQVDRVIEVLNNNTDAVPSAVAPLISSNTTEVHIQTAEQNYYTVHVDNSLTITGVSTGQAENPDVIVKTDRSTACTVYTHDNPISAGLQAYENQDVTIEATNPTDKAKVYIAKRAMDVASLFN